MSGFLQALTPLTPMTVDSNPTGFMPAGSNLTSAGMTPYNSSAGMFGIQGLGANTDTLRMGLGGLQALGGLWSANQQNKLAKKSFNFQKGILDTNLANQIKAYNLSIDDKFRSRAVVEGTPTADRDANIARWSATDQRKG